MGVQRDETEANECLLHLLVRVLVFHSLSPRDRRRQAENLMKVIFLRVKKKTNKKGCLLLEPA